MTDFSVEANSALKFHSEFLAHNICDPYDFIKALESPDVFTGLSFVSRNSSTTWLVKGLKTASEDRVIDVQLYRDKLLFIVIADHHEYSFARITFPHPCYFGDWFNIKDSQPSPEQLIAFTNNGAWKGRVFSGRYKGGGWGSTWGPEEPCGSDLFIHEWFPLPELD